VFDDRCEAVKVVPNVSKGRSTKNFKTFGKNVSIKDDSGVKIKILKGENIGES